MRETKFRAYDKETKSFICSDETHESAWFQFQDGKLKAFAIHGMTSGTLDEPPQPNCEELEEPEQYTGKKDRTGKDAFESDRVKGVAVGLNDPEKIEVSGVIRWDDEDTGFYIDNDTDNWPHIKMWFLEWFEIVGYEIPEVEETK